MTDGWKGSAKKNETFSFLLWVNDLKVNKNNGQVARLCYYNKSVNVVTD